MILKKAGLVTLCLATILLFGCGKKENEKQKEQASKETTQRVEQGKQPGKRSKEQAKKPEGQKEEKKSSDWFDRMKKKIGGKDEEGQ